MIKIDSKFGHFGRWNKRLAECSTRAEKQTKDKEIDPRSETAVLKKYANEHHNKDSSMQALENQNKQLRQKC